MLTLELKGLGEVVQDLQEEVVVLPQQLPNRLLAQPGAEAQKAGDLLCSGLLVQQMYALWVQDTLLRTISRLGSGLSKGS